MSELDLPALPALPEAHPDDVEDVSWALSTAEAMWARGDHAEGMKWVRKAAEAAADAENDARALELAKAASDLAAAIARRSAHSSPEMGRVAEPPPPPSQEATVPGIAASQIVEAVTAPPGAPSLPAGARPASSAPPPVPNRASGKPSRSVAPPRPPATASGAPRPGPPSKAPRPLASSVQPPEQAPASRDGRDKKSKRRTRDNLEEAARTAGLLVDAQANPPAIDTRDATGPLASTSEMPALTQHLAATKPPTRGAPQAAAIEWDRSPTQALSSEDLAALDGDRQTSFGAPPPHIQDKARPPSKSLHDEDIRTTQAVRVVVWKDGNGVHVAPEGTVVSAITTSAVLVALDPSADLTAWLSRRGR